MLFLSFCESRTVISKGEESKVQKIHHRIYGCLHRRSFSIAAELARAIPQRVKIVYGCASLFSIILILRPTSDLDVRLLRKGIKKGAGGVGENSRSEPEPPNSISAPHIENPSHTFSSQRVLIPTSSRLPHLFPENVNA